MTLFIFLDLIVCFSLGFVLGLLRVVSIDRQAARKARLIGKTHRAIRANP
jgi:hypothetical protein